MSRTERLMWQLFLKLREVLPATHDNAKWASVWAAEFHEQEQEGMLAGQPATSADHDEPHEPVGHSHSARPRRK